MQYEPRPQRGDRFTWGTGVISYEIISVECEYPKPKKGLARPVNFMAIPIDSPAEAPTRFSIGTLHEYAESERLRWVDRHGYPIGDLPQHQVLSRMYSALAALEAVQNSVEELTDGSGGYIDDADYEVGKSVDSMDGAITDYRSWIERTTGEAGEEADLS